jgi:hypothetical protein
MQRLEDKRRVARLGVAFFSLFLVWGCYRKGYTDRYVETGRISNFQSLLNVHASSVPYLKISGITFKNVQGDSPFFLKVPGHDAIIFVTKSKDELQTVLHLAKLGDKEIIAVDLGDSIFGSGIQPTAKPGEYCDWIQSYSPTELIVVTKNTYGQIVTSIDLSRKMVKGVEKYRVDRSGKVGERFPVESIGSSQSEGLKRVQPEGLYGQKARATAGP